MSIIYLTIFISLLLATVFVICFVMEAWRGVHKGVEKSSLLPLEDDEETPDYFQNGKSNDHL